MTVKMRKTGEIVTVNDSYGARLIEQGKAVAAKAPAKGKGEAKAGEAK